MLVFEMGAFSEMPVDVSRICDIIDNELARIHVSYYNDNAWLDQRTKFGYRRRTLGFITDLIIDRISSALELTL